MKVGKSSVMRYIRITGFGRQTLSTSHSPGSRERVRGFPFGTPKSSSASTVTRQRFFAPKKFVTPHVTKHLTTVTSYVTTTPVDSDHEDASAALAQQIWIARGETRFAVGPQSKWRQSCEPQRNRPHVVKSFEGCPIGAVGRRALQNRLFEKSDDCVPEQELKRLTRFQSLRLSLPRESQRTGGRHQSKG